MFQNEEGPVMVEIAIGTVVAVHSLLCLAMIGVWLWRKATGTWPSGFQMWDWPAIANSALLHSVSTLLLIAYVDWLIAVYPQPPPWVNVALFPMYILFVTGGVAGLNMLVGQEGKSPEANQLECRPYSRRTLFWGLLATACAFFCAVYPESLVPIVLLISSCVFTMVFAELLFGKIILISIREGRRHRKAT